MASPRPSRNELWALAAIVAIGVLVRFTTLEHQSLWYDEADTRSVVASSLGNLFSRLPQSELNPPLYYVLLWLWTHVAGIGEAGLRSFSAACGVLTIPVMWVIGRRQSPRVGLIAALLTAVNPLMYWYSQEARNYALLTLLSALSLLFVLRAADRPSNRRLLAWGAICALALGTHYFAFLAIAPQAIWLVWTLRASGRLSIAGIALALAPLAVTAVAIAPLAARQSQTDASFIAESASLTLRTVLLVVEDVAGTGVLVPALGGVLVALLVVFLPREPARNRDVTLLLAVGLGAVATALLAALAGHDYFSTRNLMPSWPAFALLVATGLGLARRPLIGTIACGLLVAVSVLGVVAVIAKTEFHRANWRGAARALGPAAPSRAIVSYDVAETSLSPYLGGLSRYPRGGAPIREIDVLTLHGRWLGTEQRRLRAAPPVPGFRTVRRVDTPTYGLVRYRSRSVRVVPYAALRALYPELPGRRVVLQTYGSGKQRRGP